MNDEFAPDADDMSPIDPGSDHPPSSVVIVASSSATSSSSMITSFCEYANIALRGTPRICSDIACATAIDCRFVASRMAALSRDDTRRDDRFRFHEDDKSSIEDELSNDRLLTSLRSRSRMGCCTPPARAEIVPAAARDEVVPVIEVEVVALRRWCDGCCRWSEREVALFDIVMSTESDVDPSV